MKLNWLPRIDGSLDIIYTENTGFVDEPFLDCGTSGDIPIWDGGTRLAQIRRASVKPVLRNSIMSTAIRGERC